MAGAHACTVQTGGGIVVAKSRTSTRVHFMTNLHIAPDNKSTHSVVIGYLLWIVGFTGAHRFYYGKPISGAIWFFTLGLLGVGWLIDVVLIPSMDRKADLRYVEGHYDFSVAWLLHTYLGVFGVHRFYMGKWATGILYLLTGGLLGIGWIYDFFTLNGQVSDRNLEAGRVVASTNVALREES